MLAVVVVALQVLAHLVVVVLQEQVLLPSVLLLQQMAFAQCLVLDLLLLGKITEILEKYRLQIDEIILAFRVPRYSSTITWHSIFNPSSYPVPL